MRAVVTGAAGFVGSHLTEALLMQGHDVLAVDNLVNGSLENLPDHPDLRFVEADILDWATPENLDGIEVVFHQAASIMTVGNDEPELDLQVNALGTLRLTLAARAAGVRKFVQASTGSVLGPSLGAWDEHHPTLPLTYYGASKLAAESYVRLSGLDYSILRYFHIIGPRQDPGAVVRAFVLAAVRGEPITIYGTGEQVRSFTSVRDIAEANIRSVEWPNCLVNVGSQIKVSIIDLAEFVRSEVAPVPIRYEPERPGEVYDFELDCSSIRALGMTFNTDWRAIVREVIQCELASGH